MGFIKKLLLAVIVTAISAGVYQIFLKPVKMPTIDYNVNWGDDSKAQSDTGIKPFKVDFGPKVIDELKNELSRPRYLEPSMKDTAFTYGFNSEAAENLIKYWRDNYLPKWNERQTLLNSFPQFTVTVQGLRLHYIHIKADKKSGKEIIPLILLHGWPGSVREFYELIPKLKDVSKTKNYAFDIIVPSLPGYGWSEATRKTGLATTEMAVIMKNLMVKLGYTKFVVQGGDWGSMIGALMATMFPENVIGYHSNMCVVAQSPLYILKSIIASYVPSLFVKPEYTDFHYPAGEKFKMLIEETGYLHLQATKPDTIGNALIHNPVGLAIYIIEKFSTWSQLDNRNRNDGGFKDYFDMDALLDNIMIYYLSNSITSSMRLYSESFTLRHMALRVDAVQTSVPTGCARYKYDLGHVLDWQLKDKYTNLIHSKYYVNAGHFAALQVPDHFYKDFIEFIDSLRAFIKK